MKQAYSYNLWRDGVTYSMISCWLNCREQARLKYVEGWTNTGESLALSYGTAAHYVLQKAYEELTGPPGSKQIQRWIGGYDAEWRKWAGTKRISGHVEERHQLILGMLGAVMPSYFQKAGSSHPLYRDYKKEWVECEQVFSRPFKLPDGRIIPIRGKRDAVFKSAGKYWLFETKNLSRIDEEEIADTLPLDMQSMIYLWALRQENPTWGVAGTVRNILRRPGLRQSASESLKDFLGRIAADVSKPERTDHYFLRFRMPVFKGDLDLWVKNQLTPILISMADWWEDLRATGGTNHHFTNPFALVNKYGRVDMYDMIVKGDKSAYVKKPCTFVELAE